MAAGAAITTGLAGRRIEPELLDSLPASDPRAMRSRRDLARINALMFQSAIMASLLRPHKREGPARILEIGCGDGSFMLSAARRLGKRWSDVDLVLLDRVALVSAGRIADFAALGWGAHVATGDVFAFVNQPGIGTFDIVAANLFLHHFSDRALQTLFERLSRLAPVLVATEPRRTRIALWATGLLRVIGANDVSRHDAAASVRAGFRGAELSALWPKGNAGRIDERGIGPFTHSFSVNQAAGGAP